MSPKDALYVPKASFLQHFQKSRKSESLRPFHNWRTIRSDQIVVRSKNLDLDRKLLPK